MQALQNPKIEYPSSCQRRLSGNRAAEGFRGSIRVCLIDEALGQPRSTGWLTHTLIAITPNHGIVHVRDGSFRFCGISATTKTLVLAETMAVFNMCSFQCCDLQSCKRIVKIILWLGNPKQTFKTTNGRSHANNLSQQIHYRRFCITRTNALTTRAQIYRSQCLSSRIKPNQQSICTFNAQIHLHRKDNHIDPLLDPSHRRQHTVCHFTRPPTSNTTSQSNLSYPLSTTKFSPLTPTRMSPSTSAPSSSNPITFYQITHKSLLPSLSTKAASATAPPSPPATPNSAGGQDTPTTPGSGVPRSEDGKASPSASSGPGISSLPSHSSASAAAGPPVLGGKPEDRPALEEPRMHSRPPLWTLTSLIASECPELDIERIPRGGLPAATSADFSAGGGDKGPKMENGGRLLPGRRVGTYQEVIAGLDDCRKGMGKGKGKEKENEGSEKGRGKGKGRKRKWLKRVFASRKGSGSHSSPAGGIDS